MRRHAGPLKQLRVMADMVPELATIRSDLKCLLADFERQQELDRKFAQTFDRCGEMIMDLEEQFKRVTDPLMKFICKDQSTASSNSSSAHAAHVCVSVNNLNEFITEEILAEYLRQQLIFVEKIKRTIGYNERSRNFVITLKEADLERLLVADLWPRGVTLSVRGGECRAPSVHGNREKNLPALLIGSGMSYWHS